MYTSLYTGTYMVGQSHVVAFDRVFKPSARHIGLLHAPGGGGTATSWMEGGTTTDFGAVGQALQPLIANFPLVTFASDWTWGNAACMKRMSALYGAAKAFHGFDRDKKVLLSGVSMGGACVLNWARRNLSKVRAIALMDPCVDLQDIEANNRIGTYGLPQPSTAYGGSAPSDDWNPTAQAAWFRKFGIPIKVWYSNNDSICTPASVQDFIARSGAESYNMGNQTGSALTGHGLFQNWHPLEVRDFFLAHVPEAIV